MKEFYKKANSLLKIKRNNPVVTKVIREDELGEAQVFEEKSSVDNVIAQYFNDIYKRPDYRRRHFRSDNFDVDDDEVMRINTSNSNDVSPFTQEEVLLAVKSSNYNKGLGPDCFDGNVMKNNPQLQDKVVVEITNALNSGSIPDYLRVGRLIPL
jgi:hypothetical protein